MARFGRSFPIRPKLPRLLIPSGPASITRTVNDSAPAVDTATQTLVLATRTTSDSAPASDTAAVTQRVYVRAVADIAQALDTVASFRGPVRQISEVAPAVDSVTRALIQTRAVSDSAPAVDTVTWRYPRLASDSAPAIDTVTRGALLLARAIADSAPAVDTLGRAGVGQRSVADSAPAVDTLSPRGLLLPRLVPESAPAVDTLTRGPLIMARTVSDTAPAVDTMTGVVVGAGTPAVLANPAWPLMGFDVDFQAGPPAVPGATRMSINAQYRRLFVRQWSTNRGRQYELDQVQAGTANLQLPDPLEYLNPDNSGSPYNQGANKITPYRSMWIWAMWPNQPGSGNVNNPAVDPTADASFETTVGGWARTGGTTTLAVTTAQAFAGTHSMLVTQSAAGTGAGVFKAFRTAPAVTYTFSAYVRPTGGCTVSARVVDALGNVTVSNAATVQNVWTRIFLSWTTVDTLEPITIYGTGTATPTFYVDAAQVEFGSNLTAFTTTGPTLYPIFTGYVERYPTTYDMSGSRAIRPLQAVDGLAILSRTSIAQSYDAEIAADNPAMYYPLSSKSSPATGTQLGAGMGLAAAPRYVVSANGSINWGGDAHPDGTPAVVFTSQNPTNPPTQFPPNSFTEMVVQGGQISVAPATTGMTWEGWIRWVSGTAQFGTLEVLHQGDPPGLNVAVPLIGAASYAFDRMGWLYNFNGTDGGVLISPALFPDGMWHYACITVQGSLVKAGVDGPPTVTTTTTPIAAIGFNTFYSEASSQYAVAQAQNSTGRFALYQGILSNARITAHYQRGVGYIGEASGARIARLLATYWPAATSVAGGSAQLAPDWSYNGRTVLDVAQEIQETERGLFYVAANGTVVFESRTTPRYLANTAVAVFGENPTGASPVEYPYEDIKFDHDPTYTFSQANLSRPGNTQVAPMVNAAAQAKYGQRILSQTLQVNTDFDVQQAGVFYLQRYSSPKTRVSTLVLRPSANPALWPVILGLEISQRITVRRRSAFTKSADFYIETIAHQVDAETSEWRVTLQLSPVFNPIAWVLGDATYGVVGTTSIPVY